MKSWILGLIADSNLSALEALNLPSLEEIRAIAAQKITSASAPLGGLHAILSAILHMPAWIARFARAHGERRICVASGNQMILPTLENLSSGQTSLFSIFGTILRYADYGLVTTPQDQIEGIVLVDEIDAHLHADLQHDVLPSLIKQFPRVQFIVTSHSPLFPLGMQKLYGDDGFALIELPSGVTITAERFSEFESSFIFFQATKSFEDKVRQTVKSGQKPLILCEGKTDPRYLATAAELLGLDLFGAVEFEWVGTKTGSSQSDGGGDRNLNNALRFLQNNPQFVTRKTVLLYDCDTHKPSGDFGDLFVRSIPMNSENQEVDKGIENLLPVGVFEERLYSEVVRKEGARRVTVRDLRKTALCEHLCSSVRNPDHFAKFSDVLSSLQGLLMPVVAAPAVETSLLVSSSSDATGENADRSEGENTGT